MRSTQRIKTRGSFTMRQRRFAVASNRVQVIARNSSARFSSFWLELVNLSAKGMAIRFVGKGFLPFSVEDSLSLTLDTSSKIFARPIHLKAKICRREDNELNDSGDVIYMVTFGLEIVSVDPLHQPIWELGLKRFEGVDKLEHDKDYYQFQIAS